MSTRRLEKEIRRSHSRCWWSSERVWIPNISWSRVSGVMGYQLEREWLQLVMTCISKRWSRHEQYVQEIYRKWRWITRLALFMGNITSKGIVCSRWSGTRLKHIDRSRVYQQNGSLAQWQVVAWSCTSSSFHIRQSIRPYELIERWQGRNGYPLEPKNSWTARPQRQQQIFPPPQACHSHHRRRMRKSLVSRMYGLSSIHDIYVLLSRSWLFLISSVTLGKHLDVFILLLVWHVLTHPN